MIFGIDERVDDVRRHLFLAHLLSRAPAGFGDVHAIFSGPELAFNSINNTVRKEALKDSGKLHGSGEMARQVHASVFSIPFDVEKFKEWVFFLNLRCCCVFFPQSALYFSEMGHRERTL